MYATVRRYEGIDKVRSEEVTARPAAGLLKFATETVHESETKVLPREVFHESAAAW
jgi:hypothetical protein